MATTNVAGVPFEPSVVGALAVVDGSVGGRCPAGSPGAFGGGEVEGPTSGGTEGSSACEACSPVMGGVGTGAPQFAQNFGAPVVMAEPHSVQNMMSPVVRHELL